MGRQQKKTQKGGGSRARERAGSRRACGWIRGSEKRIGGGGWGGCRLIEIRVKGGDRWQGKREEKLRACKGAFVYVCVGMCTSLECVFGGRGGGRAAG